MVLPGGGWSVLTPGTRAYADITIDPKVVSEPDLTFASATLNTHRGPVSAHWTKPAEQGVCAMALEGERLTLSCPNGGVISKIDFASFGTPTGLCLNFEIDRTCNSNNSVSVVSKLCLGKSACTVTSNVTTFGNDPCRGTDKRLYVQASGCRAATYTLEAVVPVGSMANVAVTKLSLSNIQIIEGSTPVWSNNRYQPGASGVLSAFDRKDAIVFRVGSGTYNFQLFEAASEN